MTAAAPRHLSWDVHFHEEKSIEGRRTDMPRGYPDHDHAFVEVAVMMAGHAWHRTVQGERRIGPGDAFLLRPGAWHGYHRSTGLSGYNCCFDPALLGRELAWMADDALLGRLLWREPLAPGRHGLVELHLPGKELAACRECLVALAALPVRGYVRHRADHVAGLVRILGILARNLPPPSAPVQQATTHGAVTATLALLEDDLARPWTLTGLAARVQVTPAYLVRLFRRATGLPPMAYLVRRRGERAAGLLLSTGEAIGRIGARLGWPDANYFTRRFRAQFGMAPSAYRERFSRQDAAHRL